MSCLSCGAALAGGAKFCSECGAPQALACSSCGSPHAPGANFCAECGAALTAAGAVPRGTASPAGGVAPVAERRLVSVLFADLVGFTTASEGRDAEDTRELLTRYFDTCRAIIERYGGTVEKFIGDAVMAVWGAPVATEDDAERAVRAALDLVDAIPTLDPALQARTGVLTGEAAVTLGATDQGMVAGDLVNTAARIQSAAEPGTVLVGDTTRHATEASVVYADAGVHEMKGKAEPQQLWQALRVVAARKGEGRSIGLEAPFVGRDREFRLLKGMFHAAATDRRASLVNVIGVAGIGKSRLAWEFEKYVDGLADGVFWHRGRCLSYGDGIAFWALAEMVRMRAGIAEDEDESSALAKLRDTVADLVPDPAEREWIEPRLQHLLGLVERVVLERDDLFSAWRTFFERMAERGAVALVFEDLHWADEGLVAFVEHLLEWSRTMPILVLALARPELSERHPGFGSRVRSAATLMLDPLDDRSMEELLVGLVPGLPADTRETIRERADGIPLYAVETVRMLLDRGLLERDGDTYAVTGQLDALAVPETLHALIAARLDGLEHEERRLLERAAVLGKTFSARGLAALAELDEKAVELDLASLVRKELLSLDTDARSPERGQYGFLQALVQRVAYETLSRRERRSLHLAAAAYLAQDAGIDSDEIAEVIAAHYRDADAADPGGPDAAEVRSRAREWLRRAGDRAEALAAVQDARRAFDEAAALADDDPERAALLERAGAMAFAGNEFSLAVERLEAARRLFDGVGDTHAAARAAARQTVPLWHLGRSDEAAALVEQAFVVLAADEPDTDIAMLAEAAARVLYFRGEARAAMERVELALEIAEAVGLTEVISYALNTKALLLRSRPHEALALHREALAVGLEHGHVLASLRAFNNLAIALANLDRVEESERVELEALEFARSRGIVASVVWFGGIRCGRLVENGRWDEALALAGEMLPRTEVTQGNVAQAFCALAGAALERGAEDEARRLLGLVAPGIDASPDLQVAVILAERDRLLARLAGDVDLELERVDAGGRQNLELDEVEGAAEILAFGFDVARGENDLARLSPLLELVEAVPASRRPRKVEAHLGRAKAAAAVLVGDLDGAIDHLAAALAAARSLGKARLLAMVLGDYGCTLVRAGRPDEARELLDEARSLFEEMGSVVWLERLRIASASTTTPTRA